MFGLCLPALDLCVSGNWAALLLWSLGTVNVMSSSSLCLEIVFLIFRASDVKCVVWSWNSNKPMLCVCVCAFLSEALVQWGGEEQGNHTGSLLHGILYHFQTTMKKTLSSLPKITVKHFCCNTADSFCFYTRDNAMSSPGCGFQLRRSLLSVTQFIGHAKQWRGLIYNHSV